MSSMIWAAQAFEDLRQQVASEAPAPIASPAPASTSAPIPDPGFHRYDALYQQNPDFFGWVRIDDTRINYPVMHTPDDPEYYLRRAFDGTDSAAGVPFLDAACTADGLHWIVYGHHMDNGSMFADLTQYADESFWRDHPTIHFDTLNEPGEYQILAVFYAQAYHPEDTDVFRYYAYTDLSDPETYAEYLENVRDAALYDTGLTAAYGDPLLTLSTCSEHTTDGRFVVVAKKIEATNETL